MSNTLDHKCPSCNAVLKFNPHGQNWKCEYCRSEFNIQQLEEYEKKTGKVLEEESTNNDIDLYLCKNCGAEIIADPNVSTTSCVYCKNTAILKNNTVSTIPNIGVFNTLYILILLSFILSYYHFLYHNSCNIHYNNCT